MVCVLCFRLFLAEISIESLPNLFTLPLSIETKGQIIRTESVDIIQYLFVFLLRGINKNIYLAKEAPRKKTKVFM